MIQPNRILLFQTAFLGDVILTLPLAQALHRQFPKAEIDFLTTPLASELLRNHPALHSVIVYDKRKAERGIRGMISIAKKIRDNKYDVALVPHRSLRSAIVTALGIIPIRVGFTTSAGRFLFTNLVHYDKHVHEVERNLLLLNIFGIAHPEKEYPSLYPSVEDAAVVDRFLSEHAIGRNDELIAVAPGSVWNTKRWLSESFSKLVPLLSTEGLKIILVGGKEDEALCNEIVRNAGSSNVYISAGKFSLLQSAELLRRCRSLVTNDSAPMHIAVAMRIPVVAIFGATVPSFGFAPYGKKDIIVETMGLSCRPCSIHGGDVCPIGTFDCMRNISAEMVYKKVMELQ